jgi:hypothetical protein
MNSRKGIFSLTVLAVCAAFAYLSTVITLSNVIASRAPTAALRFWPLNAVAHARLADALIGANPAHPPIGAVREHAVAALRRNPTLASAARDLGLLAALRGDLATADRHLQYADAMSRRDIPTQLWLIERSVAANDVTGALAHYGVALRVSPETGEQLFPVLAAALNDADLVLPIARLVRDGDLWRSQFLYFVNANATNLPHLTSLYLDLDRLGAKPVPVHILGLMGRLLQAGELDAAARLYALLDPQWRRGDLVAQLDGDFDHANDMPPLGWALEPGVVSRGGRPGNAGNPALHLNVPTTDSVLGARRLLMLTPGTYHFAANYGRSDGNGEGSLRIELACLQGGAPASLIIAPIPRQSGRVDGTLQVAGCQVQWLSISVERRGDPTPVTAWLDDLRLGPAGGRDNRRDVGRQ